MRFALAMLAAALPLAGADQELPKILWHEPAPLTAEHWKCGPAPCSAAPAPPFEFVARDKTATNPKVTVKDARGRSWSVKFGGKVVPECFCARYVTAIGYLDEPSWFVPEGVIQGMGREKMSVLLGNGRFVKARFQARGQQNFEFLDKSAWRWTENPFVGTRELSGLKVLMMLLSNWDTKDGRPGEDSNDAVFRVVLNGRPELFYGVFDWGAGLGYWGGPLRRDQGDCSGYTHDTPNFVRRTSRGLEWGFQGKHADEIKRDVTVEHVRWLLPYLKRITPDDMRAAFKASGATERQAGCWIYSIQDRVRQLAAAAN